MRRRRPPRLLQTFLQVVGATLLAAAGLAFGDGDHQRGLALLTLAGLTDCLRVLDRVEIKIEELRREFGERRG